MKLVIGLVVASIISWLVASAMVDRQTSLEILCGMFGPLASVCVTWMLAERIFRRRPEALTPLLVTALAGKLVFFGVYVTVGLRVLSLRPVPFVASFTSYFIALYLIEALYLRRLFRGGMRASR